MKSYNIQIEKLCIKCGLGRLIEDTKPITGGYLHRMYDVCTESGRYAIKALNPSVMERNDAYNNYIISEQIASKLSGKISVSCANPYNDAYIQELEGQFYLIYDFIEGKALEQADIKANHAFKIGEVVAIIHSTDFTDLGLVNDNVHEDRVFDWESLLLAARDNELGCYELLKDNIDKLYFLSDRMNEADAKLSFSEIICHGDLDPKNVLWQGDNPVIIDWESAWFYNPEHDFLETALYWSQNPDMTVDYERLSAFIDGYTSIRSIRDTDWLMVLYSGFSAKLGWLEYNLKRALGIECVDEKEQELGRKQVVSTMKEILEYEKQMDEVNQFLRKRIGVR